MANPPNLEQEFQAMLAGMQQAHLEHLQMWCDEKEPTGALLPSLSDAGMRAIGYIVSQWGGLENQMAGQITWYRQIVPDELRVFEPRREFSHRLNYLERLVDCALQDAPRNGLRIYKRNLSRIRNFKSVRDNLVHGFYTLVGNQGFDGVTVIVGDQKRAYSTKRLETVAKGIGECSGVFLNFTMWLEAPELKTSLQKSHGQTPEPCILVTPHRPPPPPESSEG